MPNYCVSDTKSPNFYKWVFSKEYPRFPCSLSNFTREDLFDCIEALEGEHLRVVRVEAARPDDRTLLDLKRIEDIAKEGGKEALEEAAQNAMLELIGESEYLRLQNSHSNKAQRRRRARKSRLTTFPRPSKVLLRYYSCGNGNSQRITHVFMLEEHTETVSTIGHPIV